MRVTISDIARATGYSKTTISFAFNDPSRVSAEARAVILQTANEMGYVPDPVARSLSKRKLDTIGLLLPHSIPFAFENPYLVRLVRGLGEVCTERGLSLTMLPPRRGDLLKSVRTAAVDGLVTIGLHPEHDVVKLIHHRHMPFVTVDGKSGEDVPSIMVDDAVGAESVMRHLMAEGHRHIAIGMLEEARAPDQEEYSGIGKVRLAGYENALRKDGISLGDKNVHVIDVPCSPAGGELLAKTVCESLPQVTAIVCMSDVIAIGVYRELYRRGKRIPQEYSVAGFDDIPEAERITPALTTVHQPAEEKGRAAASLLLSRIERRDTKDVRFTCRLVVRESVRRVIP